MDAIKQHLRSLRPDLTCRTADLHLDEAALRRMVADDIDDLMPHAPRGVRHLMTSLRLGTHRGRLRPPINLLISRGGDDVGFLTLNMAHPGEIRLIDVVVRPTDRNAGIGTALLRAARQAAADHRRTISAILLYDSPARALFERIGFRPTTEQGVEVRYVWKR